ncbi:MAG: 50S ribosomal protein L18 [Candidatus Omnitrophota bacterium]
MKEKKEVLRLKRHRRIRMHMYGSEERPRLIVHRSIRNFSAQIIDDTNNKTIFSLSTQDKEIKEKFPSAGNVKASIFFAGVFARRAKEKGISRVVFDRAGYRYQGKVRAFAEALRKGGMEF